MARSVLSRSRPQYSRGVMPLALGASATHHAPPKSWLDGGWPQLELNKLVGNDDAILHRTD